MKPSSHAVWILFVSSIAWGLTWIPIKFLGAQGLSGIDLVFYAFGAAALCLMPVLLWQFQRWHQHMWSMVLIMLFGGMANISFQVAIVYGDVIRVMILFYLLPVWSVLGARLFLGERIDRLRIMSVVMAIAGAMLILNGPGQLSGGFTFIDFLALMAGFSFAMNNLVFRATPQLPIASKVAAMFVGVLVLILIYRQWQQAGTAQAGELDLFFPVLYGIAWIMVITFATQWGVTRIEAGRAAVIIVMELVASVVSAALWYQQVLSWVEMIGVLLVLTAAITEGSREEQREWI